MVKTLITRVRQSFGHFDHGSMFLTVRKYYFKNMYKLIVEYCRTCDICNKNKTQKYFKLGTLGLLGPTTTVPFEIVSINTIGCFGSRSTKKYLYLTIDYFTRYAFLLTKNSKLQ